MLHRTEKKRIVVLPGDGVGPEVMAQGVKLLKALEGPFGFEFEFEEYPVGGAALDAFGVALPQKVLDRCRLADAVLLGPVGSDRFASNPPQLRPEKALKDLRVGVDAYCNLRSIRMYNRAPAVTDDPAVAQRDIDLAIIRNLREGLYFEEAQLSNEDRPDNGSHTGNDSSNARLIERTARKALELARLRRRKITLVHQQEFAAKSANWLATIEAVAADYSDVELSHMPAARCLAELEINPFQFDVLLTEVGCGEAINTRAQLLVESVGMLASACLGDDVCLYQPVHRTEHALAGRDVASPIAMMNSVALMMQYSFNRPLAARNIEEAILTILARGYRTSDLNTAGDTIVGTAELGNQIVEEMSRYISVPFMTA